MDRWRAEPQRARMRTKTSSWSSILRGPCNACLSIAHSRSPRSCSGREGGRGLIRLLDMILGVLLFFTFFAAFGEVRFVSRVASEPEHVEQIMEFTTGALR